jgi:hypothetical protein
MSLASGLLVWPVLLVVCFFEGAPVRTLLTAATAGVAMWIFYFIGYISPPECASPWVSLIHPMTVAAFTFTFLTSVFGSTPFRFAGVLGVSSLSIGIIGFILYSRASRDPLWRLRAFFVYLALFIVATALLTGLGRLNYGLGQASAIRYRTPSLIFWASILGLGFSWWNGIAGGIGRSLGTQIFSVIFLAVFVLPAQQAPIEQFARMSKQINRDSIALAFDATDDVYGRLFCLKPDLVCRYAPFLRENHLSIFADRLFTARGESLTNLFVRTSAQECSGSFEGLKLLDDPAKQKGTVFGWGWLRRESRGPETIVLADNGGTIVGLAHGMEPRPDVAAHSRNPKMVATGWSGYFHAEPSSRIITAYAVLPDGKTLCPLGQARIRR